MIKKYKKLDRGMALLPAVIVLGIMAVTVAVAMMAVSFNESLTSQGLSESSRAIFYAEAGARDALIKITRNKNYTCSNTDCYSLDFITNGCSAGNGCAKISVSAGLGTNSDPKVITSKGIMKNATRTIEVSVILDGGTSLDLDQLGNITSTTWTELTN